MARSWDEKQEQVLQLAAALKTLPADDQVVAASTDEPLDWGPKVEALRASRPRVAGTAAAESATPTGELSWPTAETLKALRSWRRS